MLTALKTATITFALMGAVTGATVIAADAAGRHGERIFTRLDANNDGEITLEEIAPGTDMRFSRWDGDGDGRITAEEIDIRIKKMTEAGKARAMERFDTDGDGVITRAEADAQTSEIFAKADTDGSGGLSRQEAMALAREMMAEWHAARRDAAGPRDE